MPRTRRPGEVSLERALSKLGIASRTQARAWIESGRVKINGIIQKDASRWIIPEKVRIEIDGVEPQLKERLVVMLHKTRGTLTTRSDERGRPTVFDLLPGELKHHGNLHAVGRLDQATTGLLLLTNDTRLSSWLTDPEQQLPRIYRVTGRGAVNESQISRMLEGILSEVGLLRASRVELVKSSGRESHLLVTLQEGKNREIRRLFEAIGSEVTDLKRLSFGGLELGNLLPGQFRVLEEMEVERAFPKSPRATGLK